MSQVRPIRTGLRNYIEWMVPMKEWIILYSLLSTVCFAKQSSHYLEHLLDQAEDYVQEKKYVEAISAYQKADIEAIRLNSQEEHLSITTELAKLLYLTGDYKDAYTLQKAMLTGQNESELDTLLETSLFAVKAGEFQDAERYLHLSEKSASDAKSKGRIYYVRALNEKQKSNYAEAISNLNKSSSFYSSANLHSKATEMIVLAGNIYQDNMANYPAAFANYEKAKKRYLSLKDNASARRIDIDWGNALLQTGKVDESIQFLLTVYASFEGELNSRDAVRCGQMLANAYYRNGDNGKAMELVKSIFTVLSSLEDEHALMVDAINLRGMIEATQGDIALAMGTFEKALKIARGFALRKEEAYLLNNMGYWHRKNGRFKESIDLLKLAVEIDRAIGNQEGLSYDLRNLGLAFLDYGQSEHAEVYLNRSLDLSQNLGIPYNILMAKFGLAKIAEVKKDHVAAAAIYKGILDEKYSQSFRSEHWQILANYGRILSELRDYDSAGKAYDMALQHMEWMYTKIPTDTSRKTFKAQKEVQDAVGDYVDLLVLEGKTREAGSIKLKWEKL